jgi:AcrR family transcriptional regulator
LFRHFKGRDEVLEEAVRLAELRIDATFPDPALAPRERLEALAQARVALLSREPGIAWLLRSAQAPLALPPPAVKRLRELVARSRAYIRRAVREAVAAGDIRDDISLDVILQVFTASVHSLVAPPGVHAKRTAASTRKRTINGLMTMLATPPSPGKRK